MKVKDLKEILKNADDDLDVEIYDGNYSIPASFAEVVECDDLNCDECGGDGSCHPKTFCVFAD